MPEEKKKESFTFSDKIKNSKPTAAKSFAKSGSSKVGSDGKPRATLLERTKRDAPFFIAALVALLLLPFLYKYSGQVDEDSTFAAPGYEDAIVNPDRSGFDLVTDDPEGKIAQFSGRDSLSYILRPGQNEADNEEVDRYDYDRSGFDSVSGNDTVSSSSKYDEEENNITNIYRHRKKAPAATRSAFRRAATKINRIGPGAMTKGNGGRLGVGMWGGGLKQAAKKAGGPKAKDSTKPVSLQPLAAAGKPSRSYFGQGAAAEARRSKDAMSKANAPIALRDAEMRAIEPGKIGGLMGGDFGGVGGGNGNLKREFAFNGKEPWWWDMMKQRAQMEWQKKFEYKWGWIEWGTNLVRHWLEGLLNCLVMGNSDGDVDNFLGLSVETSGKDTCCGWTADKCATKEDIEKAGGFKAWCKIKTNKAALKAAGADCSRGFKEAAASDVPLGPLATRLKCMGLSVSGRYSFGTPAIGNAVNCNELSSNHQYSVYPLGKARKWSEHTYHYVVARNYFPKAMVDFIEEQKFKNRQSGQRIDYPNLRLCDAYTDELRFSNKTTAGISGYDLSQEDRETYEGLELAAEQKCSGYVHNETECQKAKKAVEKFVNEHQKDKKSTKKGAMAVSRYEEEINPEDLNHACVIYVANGPVLEWDHRFRPQVEENLRRMLREYDKDSSEAQLQDVAHEAFNQLDLLMVESMISKEKLGYASWFRSGNKLDKLPMAYWHFREAYLLRYGTTTAAHGSKTAVYKRKYRTVGEDVVFGARCAFDSSAKISCKHNDNPVRATVVVGKNFKGGHQAEFNPNDITVSATYTPLAADENFQENEQIFHLTQPQADGSYVFEFKFPKKVDGGSYSADNAPIPPGRVAWHVTRGGQVISTATCDVSNAGNEPGRGTQDKECQPNGKEQSQACCQKLAPGNEWHGDKPIGQRCVPKVECQSKEDSEACCAKQAQAEGKQYTWDPNGNPEKCKLHDSQTVGTTRLAPVMSWVPATYTARNPITAEPTKEDFGPARYLPNAGTDVQKCGAEYSLKMDSTAAAAFVKAAVQEYNSRNPQVVLSDQFVYGDFPSDGEFVDALKIAYALDRGAKVKAAAVCEFGRDMVRMSQDKHTQRRVKVPYPVDSPYVGNKTEQEQDAYFHNDLGAFLAYIHGESILYPQKKYVTDQNCDYRFSVIAEGTPCQSGQAWSSPSANDRKFHHSNYNQMVVSGGIYPHYERSLTDAQKAWPLAGLVSGKTIATYTTCDGTKKCDEEGSQYVRDINLLLREGANFTAWQGKACTDFYGGDGPDLEVKKVLDYITGACEAGLDYKPSGVPGSSGGPRRNTGRQNTTPGVNN